LLITTRNRRDELLRTLAAMVPVLGSGNEIIVLDDGSTDATSQALQQAFSGVRVLREEQSRGYIAGRNRLLGMAVGTYAISLDDDSEIVSPEALPEIARHFAENPRCGAIAMRIYWGPSLPPDLTAPQEPPHRVKSFVGCGHAWKMGAWHSIVPYPEWFEFYGEEDFASIQLFRHGWEVHYLPQVVVHHRAVIRARPLSEQRWRFRRQFRSGLFLMGLFYPWPKLLWHLAYACWAQFQNRFRYTRNWRLLPAFLGALGDLLRRAPLLWRQRQPLTAEQWRTWQSIPGSVLYWQVPKTVDATASAKAQAR